jgi:hypothetical protein
VALAGTWAAAAFELVRLTVAPAGGAAPFSNSVPVDEDPPTTVLGDKLSDCRAAGFTVSVVVRVVPYTAVSVTDIDEATPLVVIWNVVLLAPAGIVTLTGACAAAVLLLCNVTTAPFAGAAPFRVTVPVELLPPTTELGLLVIEDNVAAVTVRVVVLVTAAYVAESVTEVVVATGLVVIVNVALLEPAGTVTLTGACAADVLLLCSATLAPCGGAAPFKVTVPVELFPPITEVGVRVIEDKVAGLTVSVAVFVTPNVALMPAVDGDATPNVVTVNVAEVVPAATVTEAGTVAATVLPLCSVTTAPPVGAAAVSCTVATELLPPTTVVGFSETEDTLTAGGITVKVAVCVVPAG